VSDSSTGGYLAPALSPGPLEDDALDDFIQEFVVGITALDGQYVRPRWQPEPPNLPPEDVNWAAVGIASREGDTYSVELHDPAGDGADIVIRHETLNILATFYGPASQAMAAKLRDGLGLAQNREPLFAQNMGLVSVGQLSRGPELVKNKWLPKVDLPFAIRREIRRCYPVLNLMSGQITLQADAGLDPITVTPTAP
jgi:hypothetical protein